MKSRTSGILVACFAIAVANFGMSVEVSSMVDLDSDESAETSGTAIADQSESADPSIPVSHVSRSAVIGRRRASELVKATEPRKRRIYSPRVSSVITTK